MILFFNVLITDSRFSQGVTNRADRLDLFKYTLASYAPIDRIKEVIIYCELEGQYSDRYMELCHYVRKIFFGREIAIYPQHSPANQKAWQKALLDNPSLSSGQPILYSGNDDHVFIDHDTDVLYEGLDLTAREPTDQINAIIISSWVEAISTVYGLGEFEQVGRFWSTPMFYPDAIQIVNWTFFKHIFFDLDLKGDKMRRTDGVLHNWYPYLGDFRYASSQPHPTVKSFIPLRELVRHFDAYVHVEVSEEDCPKLTIPEGFFGAQFNRGPVPADYNEAHRRRMTAPHMRAWQNPTIRQPAKHTDKFRDFGRDRLPLEEKYIQAGYRSLTPD